MPDGINNDKNISEGMKYENMSKIFQKKIGIEKEIAERIMKKQISGLFLLISKKPIKRRRKPKNVNAEKMTSAKILRLCIPELKLKLAMRSPVPVTCLTKSSNKAGLPQLYVMLWLARIGR